MAFRAFAKSAAALGATVLSYGAYVAYESRPRHSREGEFHERMVGEPQDLSLHEKLAKGALQATLWSASGACVRACVGGGAVVVVVVVVVVVMVVVVVACVCVSGEGAARCCGCGAALVVRRRLGECASTRARRARAGLLAHVYLHIMNTTDVLGDVEGFKRLVNAGRSGRPLVTISNHQVPPPPPPPPCFDAAG